MAEARIAQHIGWAHRRRAADDSLQKCVAWTWRVKLSLSTERDLFARLREAAEAVAIKVFADNLRDLLLAAPVGPRVVMGLDPGIRTGVKVAVVDPTGELLAIQFLMPDLSRYPCIARKARDDSACEFSLKRQPSRVQYCHRAGLAGNFVTF